MLRDALWGTSYAAPVPELWGHGDGDCTTLHPISIQWTKVLLFRLDDDPHENTNLAHEYIDVVKQMVADYNEKVTGFCGIDHGWLAGWLRGWPAGWGRGKAG